VLLDQPRSTEERAQAARTFVKQYGFQASKRALVCSAGLMVDGTMQRRSLLSAPGSGTELGYAHYPTTKRAVLQPPMLVDPIHNPFDAVLAPWPLRFYILHRGRIHYKAQVGILG
jgi:hypothetical protein